MKQDNTTALAALDITSPIQPVRALLGTDRPGVLAFIVGVDGPSYRPLGAMMAVFDDGTRIGNLSSGCVESDIANHALQALADGRPKQIRYGRGSPFFDIQLPCGGGLSILLVPRPDKSVLRTFAKLHERRQTAILGANIETGALSLPSTGKTGLSDEQFVLRLEPELQFFVFGKGPEASTFAALVHAVGLPVLVLSPDTETMERTRRAGCTTQYLAAQDFPDDVTVDQRTAIVLFFHDHDWEPPIIAGALKTDALYIGAQGSRRTHEARMAELRAMNIPESQLARIAGPIGLIPSTRDARTLAVSVLAEVLAAENMGLT